MTAVEVPEHIFRAYDIRGIAARELGDAFVRDLGRAIGSEVRDRGGKRVAIGRDCRLSSPRIAEALSEGLLAAGIDVADQGMGPTPLLYFAVQDGGFDGGVMITGSHNPPEYNGFKILFSDGAAYGEAISALARRIRAQDFHSGAGARRVEDRRDAYVAAIVNRIETPTRRLRLSVDAGSGAAGPLARRVLEELGHEVIGHALEPDGNFPFHHPDPTTVETVELMAEHARRDRSDAVLGFDGDGDRIGVVDDLGRVIWGDRLVALLARPVLRDHPGATIVGEVKCSTVLFDEIARLGGVPDMARVGHSLMKARLKETGAQLAGEMSGHIFFVDRWFGFDDAIYAAARLTEVMCAHEGPLSSLADELPASFATPELRVDCPDELKFAVVDTLRSELEELGETVTIDGVRVRLERGWALVRASNTQPALVLRAESDAPEETARIAEDIVTRVKRAVGGA